MEKQQLNEEQEKAKWRQEQRTLIHNYVAALIASPANAELLSLSMNGEAYDVLAHRAYAIYNRVEDMLATTIYYDNTRK